MEKEPFSSFTVFWKRLTFPKSGLRVKKRKITSNCCEISRQAREVCYYDSNELWAIKI